MLLSAEKIEKYYGDRLIFQFDAFKVYYGDKIGIVGNNGAGKSTLLKVLACILAPDSGKVYAKGNIAYVDQLSGEAAGDADGMYSSILNVKTDGKSGGEIMRKKLAAAFSADFDILALDEPTSNLDQSGIVLLSSMLAGVETFLLISHDRALLDAHCNKIVEVEGGKLTCFNCGYSEYEKAAKDMRQRQESLYEEYRREKKRLENAVREREAKASKIKKAPSRMGNSEARLHRRIASAKEAKVLTAGSNIASRLERMEVIDRPKEVNGIKLDFSLTNPPQNKIVLSSNELNFSYGSSNGSGGNGKDNVIFKLARLEIKNGSHVAVIGDNGCGKSTLLKLIYHRPDLIYRVPKAKIGYMSQNFSNLDAGASMLQNVLENAVQSQTVCRNVLAGMGITNDDVYKKVGVLSGGELIKVSLARLIVSDCNILILDEPTNYLDINSISGVESALNNYQGTLIFVSHDISFIKAVASDILALENMRIVQKSTI